MLVRAATPMAIYMTKRILTDYPPYSIPAMIRYNARRAARLPFGWVTFVFALLVTRALVVAGQRYRPCIDSFGEVEPVRRNIRPPWT